MMKISYQIYDQQNEKLLAACDKELLGKTFAEEDLHLDVKESFYGGREKELDDIEKEFRCATIANLVGKNTVDKAIENGFGFEEDVLWIEGVPHLQIVRI